MACTDVALQAGFHVIGDRGVAEVVAGFRAAADSIGVERVRSGRHRLEHLEMITEEQVEELAGLGVTASVQPVFDAWWGGTDGLYENRLGSRSRGMNPYATMLRAGMTVAFGSDSPVTPMDPWHAVRAAVHHHDERQRVDVRAAIEAHTAGGWAAASATPQHRASAASTSPERRLDGGGVIEVGAPAYVAVWDAGGDTAGGDTAGDIDLAELVAPGRELPRCVMTIVAGRAAHDPYDEFPTTGADR